MTEQQDQARQLIAGWRAQAAALRARANRRGSCRAGLEAFTETTMLEQCADQAEKMPGFTQPVPAGVWVVTSAAEEDGELRGVERVFGGPDAQQLAARYASMGDMEATRMDVLTSWEQA